MKNLILIYLLLHALVFNAQVANTEWLRQLGGSGLDDCGHVEVDNNSDVIIAGEFQGVAHFGIATSTVALTSKGLTDFFIAKLAADGTTLWARQFGGVDHDGVYDLEIDASRNVYVSGQFKKTVDFDPGPSTFDVTATTTLQSNQFILKLDMNGDLVWVKIFESSHFTALMDLDANGNIYVSGSFGGIVDVDPGNGVTNLTSTGFSDVFFLKLDAQGTFKWAKRVGGTGTIQGADILVDSDGNVISAGYYNDTLDFDPGPLSFLMPSKANLSAYLLKLDSTGGFVNAIHLEENYNVSFQKLAEDPIGNLYTIAYFFTTLDMDPSPSVFTVTSLGASDVAIIKFDKHFNFINGSVLVGTDYEFAESIDFDPAGNVYVSGSFRDSVDLDPGPLASTLRPDKGSLFIASYLPNGMLAWYKQLGSQSGSTKNVVFDPSGGLYITGAFEGTSWFPAMSSYSLATKGSSDGFLLKLGGVMLGIGANGEINNMLVYPNPADDFIVIESNEIFHKSIHQADVQILDIFGRVVFNQKLEDHNRINIEKLVPGIYFLSILEDGQIRGTKKLVVE